MTARSQIRQYLRDMIASGVSVKNVYTGRPNTPLLLGELPAIYISFSDETAEVSVGSKYYVKEYLKLLEVTITIVIENTVTQGEDPYTAIRGEDYLDRLGEQVEKLFRDDWMLARRLDGFDPNTNYQGLTCGSKLTSTSVYDIETEGDRACLGSMLKYTIPYLDDGTPDRRYPYLELGDVVVIPREALDD